MSNSSTQSAQNQSARSRPVVTIWLFKDHLKVKASPTITYRRLLLVTIGTAALLAGAKLPLVIEWAQNLLVLLSG